MPFKRPVGRPKKVTPLNPPANIPQATLDKIKQGVGNYSRKKALQAAEELASRRIEALELYRPQPMQEAFHRCTANERMLQAGNRAGKSLAAFVEDARAVLGRDPYDKYPKQDGVLAIVGYKEWHIGKVIYPYLFKAGAFKIIRDTETNQWRVYRPWVPQDAVRKQEAKPAPPLIPPRMVKRFTWKDKGKGVFDTVELTTGWKILAFSSTSKPDQGYQADLFHIDEDVINEDHYNEAKGRLLDREGKFIWSALPHDDNDAIARFAERAEEQEEEHARGGPEPSSVVIRSSMMDNPYLSAQAKSDAVAGWKSMGEDVYRKRALGELATDSVMMYPIWRPGNHAIQAYKEQLIDCKKYLVAKQIPHEWCLRLAVDPGHSTGAALFMATPPHATYSFIFHEIYIHDCTAGKMAHALDTVTREKQLFETFIIDAQGGNLTSIVSGIAPREAYEDEMAKRGVKCQSSGSRFISGCSVISYREEIMRGMLSIPASGVPKILFDADTCPNLEREMRRFRKTKIMNQITDKGNRRANTHLVECLEYLATYLHDSSRPYIAPVMRRQSLTPGQVRVRGYHKRKQERQLKREMSGHGVPQSATTLAPQGVS